MSELNSDVEPKTVHAKILTIFMFSLTRDEVLGLTALRSQTVILNQGQNIRYPPIDFTKYGPHSLRWCDRVDEIMAPICQEQVGLGRSS